MRSGISILLLGILLVFVASRPADAQNRREQPREGVELEGTLTALQPGLLQVEAKDGESWLIKVEARGENLVYSGTAKPQWLRPGMWIRFRGTFNQRGQLQSELKELTVFTPAEGQQLGLVPEASLAEGLFDDEPETSKRTKPEAADYTVAGRIASIKRGKLTVAAGNVPVTIEVPESTKIIVEVSDYSLAQPGDKVAIRGWKYPMVPGRAIADRLTINAEKVLGTEETPARRGGARRRSADKEPEQEQESATPQEDAKNED